MSAEKIVSKIQTYVKSNYEKLNKNDFQLGNIPYNHRCHLNSVQKAKENNSNEVILCYAISEEEQHSCVHFINKLDSGKYQDNTWGWLHEKYDYYYIKKVNEDEYFKIVKLLVDTKETLFHLHSNWFDRRILGINKSVI